MFGGSWIADNVLYHRPCIVLTDPHSDKQCGRPSGDHTILGHPICDECWAAIQAVPAPTQFVDQRRQLADDLLPWKEQAA